jgi:hypothetical protein
MKLGSNPLPFHFSKAGALSGDLKPLFRKEGEGEILPSGHETNFHRYGVYGISLNSQIPLPLPAASESALGEVELLTAPSDWFVCVTRGAEVLESSSSWYEYSRLQDGSSYARWKGVGEFVVPADGRTIVCRQFDVATAESFYVYLLGQALSFALVRQGLEPLHATAIVVEDGAVVFLGDSGLGKSTLAACFLASGYRLLTDDLLILKQTSRNILAYPGPARIKLFPNLARKYMGKAASGVPMNPFTRKTILPLQPEQTCATPVPLRAIYSIAAVDDLWKSAIRIESLAPRNAFLELVKNTFNYRIVDAGRLERQFTGTGHLVGAAPVRKVFYPRVLKRLPAVCEALLRDLRLEPQGDPAVG